MQNIQWDKLKFEFMPTRSNIRFHYANGQWDEGQLTGDYNISIPELVTEFQKLLTIKRGKPC